MSTFEAMGLRKYSRPEPSNPQSKSNSRHHAYLKDMLISKFLSKNRLEILGPANNSTREIELKVQALVIKEFEKFMKMEQFNQKNLLQFERDLKKKIKDFLSDHSNIKLRETTAAMTHRRREIDTNHDFDSFNHQQVKNSSSVAGPKGIG